MSEASKLVGKTMIHRDTEKPNNSIGKVYVKQVVEGSRTKVVVQHMERGAGYNRIKDRITGVRTTGTDQDGNRFTNWSRKENKQFGELDEVHIKHLS